MEPYLAFDEIHSETTVMKTMKTKEDILALLEESCIEDKSKRAQDDDEDEYGESRWAVSCSVLG